MNEGTIHQLATEIGEALKRLEQFRSRIGELAAAAASVQAEAAGLDSQVRLIAEGRALRLGHARGGGSPTGLEFDPGNSSGAPGSLPASFAVTWPLLVEQVNQAAAEADLPGWQESRLTALHPLLERMALLFRQLSADEEPDLAPVTEQFGAVVGQFEALAVRLAEGAALTLSETVWDGTFAVPPLDVAEGITTVEQDGRLVPQLHLAAWMAEVESAANEQIARWHQHRTERREAAKASEAQAEAEWALLVETLTELKRRSDALLCARHESGFAPPEVLREVLALLENGLASLAVDGAVDASPVRPS